jgi:hypothetical protein
MTMRARWMAAALCVANGGSALAQSLAERVARAGDGVVAFQYAARPGVCGDGERYMRLGRSYMGSISSSHERSSCEAGPAQVALTVRGGVVERVQTWVGRPRRREGQDLGRVSTAEAAQYLVALAQRGPAGASSKAILPAVIADSATVWPALLTIARDTRTRPRATRTEAAFWLSRYAAGAMTGRKNDPLDDDDRDDRDEDGDLKSQAVFVLSQLPRGEGIPGLLDAARTNRDPRVRSQALFWLGQSGDERALALFESLLGGTK